MTKSAHKTQSMSETVGNVTHLPASMMGLGAISVAAGVIILAWPGATLTLIASVFGIFVLIYGVFRLISAIGSDQRSGGGRALLALVGVVSILVGLLVLRNPLQTLATVALLLGLFWVVSGLLETVHAAGSPGMRARGWAIAAGVVTVIAGIFVLAYPGTSLVVLVLLLGLQLIVAGIMLFAMGWQARKRARQPAPSIARPRTAPDAEGHPAAEGQATADRQATEDRQTTAERPRTSGPS